MDAVTISHVISLTVGVGGFGIAFATLWINRTKHHRDEATSNTEKLVTLKSQIDSNNTVHMMRLDSIDGGIRDLKAERKMDNENINRRFDELREDIIDVRDKSIHAQELAEAAHRRLDRAGIDPAFKSQEEKEIKC